MADWQFWVTGAVLLSIAEIVSGSFFLIWFAVGALAAALAAVTGFPLVAQVFVLLAVSLVLVIFTRPLVQRFFQGREPRLRTNLEALEGKVGQVVADIDPVRGGQVQVGGEVWSALTEGEETIPNGSRVRVREVTGARLRVEPIDE